MQRRREKDRERRHNKKIKLTLRDEEGENRRTYNDGLDAEALKERRKKINAAYNQKPEVMQRRREKDRERRHNKKIKMALIDASENPENKNDAKTLIERKRKRNEEVEDRIANYDIRKELISAGIKKLHTQQSICIKLDQL